MKTKILVVGTGAWGKNIIRTCSELGVLAGVCDVNTDVNGWYNTNYFSLFKDALQYDTNRTTFDAVIIATPPSTHYELANQALKAGKHVLVEKPMAMKSIQGKFLVKLAADAGKTLMVGHLMRYHGAFMQLLHLVKMNELGDLRYIQSNRLNDGKVRQDENVLWSFAPHDISMILALAGEMPDVVLAAGDAYVTPGVHDVTTTHMKFPSGLSANIHVNWLYPYKEQSLVVIGAKGRAVFDDTQTDPSKLMVNDKRVAYPMVNSPLTNEIQVFINCIEQANHHPITDGAEGVQVLEVLERAQASLLGEDRRFWVDETADLPRVKIPDRSPRFPDSVLPEPGKVKLFEDDLTPEGLELPEGPMCCPNASYYSCKDEYCNSPLNTGTVQIDPYAGHIAENAQIGAGTKIWAWSQVHENCKIGKDCTIGTNVQIGPNVTIGDNVKIQNNVSIYDGVTIEDDVFVGPSVVFTNVRRPRSRLSGTFEQTYVSKGATIGANATIVCGVTIGKYAMVGAGAVVTKDVRPYWLVVGVPAEPVHKVDKKGQRWDG